MKKSGFFRGVLDGIRSTVGQPSSSSSGAKALLETETEETLRPSHFKISTVSDYYHHLLPPIYFAHLPQSIYGLFV